MNGLSRSVLFIGTSYYNNEYLADSLRDMGWQAHLLLSVGENAAPFLHDKPKFVMSDCFKAVPRPWPRLFTELWPVMSAAGRSLARPAPSGLPSVLAEVAACPPDELEKALSHKGTLTAPLSALAEPCRAWLAHRDPSLTPPPELERLLEAPNLGLLRSLFQLFLRALRPAHPELAPLDGLAAGAYAVVHFTGVHSMRFLHYYSAQTFGNEALGWDIALLKRLGTRVVYSAVACFDGVLASTFARYRPEVCTLCNWRDSRYCNDARNARWGALRNELAEYQINLGGNRDDYNAADSIHETPEFYCLDADIWTPEISGEPEGGATENRDLVLYHAVGNFDVRSRGLKNIKCTHIYVPLVEKLRAKGLPVRLDLVTNVPNSELVRRQRQADIICDQLTYGWFGANAREGMMLGKPVICFLREDWLANIARELPEYVAELPVVSATPDTIETVLEDLLLHEEKRRELGRRGRAFALRWHERTAGARRMAQIYERLLRNRQNMTEHP